MLRTDDAIRLAKRQESKKTRDLLVEDIKLRNDLREVVRGVLYGKVSSFVLNYKSNFVYAPMLPGHLWTDPKGIVGPRPADVMVVNKITYPEDMEYDEDDNLPAGTMMGDSSIRLYHHLCDYGLAPDNWYVTNFIKSQHPEWQDMKTTITSGMSVEFKHILFQEIHLVQPKLIICLGADVLKAVLGHSVTIGDASERIFHISCQFPRWDSEDKPFAQEPSDVVVIGVPHPHSLMRSGDQKSLDGIHTSLQFIRKTVQSLESGGGLQDIHKVVEEEGLDHRIIRSLDEYEALADEIETECEDNLISIDAEWNGSHPQNANAYLRCFQISWKHKTAATIPLADMTEDCEFRKSYYYQGEDKTRLINITKRIFNNRRVTGHFIEADLEYLVPYGIDLRKHFSVPTSPDKYREKWLSGQACGFDTGRAAHAVTETADLSLKTQALLHTEAGKYDRELDDWIKENTLKSEKKTASIGGRKKRLDGYGILPDEILFKYAGYDADVTRRLTLFYEKLLSKDQNGNSSWKPYWIAMRALLPILEINCTGLNVSVERIQDLTEAYERKSEQLLEYIREWARWPEFNPKSSYHMREFLFGVKYNGKKLSQSELDRLCEGEEPPEFVRVRPVGAKSLNLTPLATTGKYPKPWWKVVESHKEHLSTPSTDKRVLSQLIHFHSTNQVKMPDGSFRTANFKKILTSLRNYKVLSHTLTYVLKPPKVLENGSVAKQPEIHSDGDNSFTGDLIYESGIPSFICDDGRIRTHIYPTKATGRWSSSRPSMQNLGKNIEDVIKEIFQDSYRYPLRSIIQASPGHVLIEGDYTGAEIAGAAYMCNDPLLLEHVRRNQLPENDPDFFDIHSSIAIKAFNLTCAPSKDGLKSIGKLYLRNVAKTVIFGIFYGRSPAAIAEGSKVQGFLVTKEEAQKMVDALYVLYPNLQEYFNECEQRVYEPGWVCNAFGRYRRFAKPLDITQGRAFGRQCKNFPIQGLVADAVNRAVDHLYCLRNKMKLRSKIVLSVHDAILMEVPYDEILVVKETLLPKAMTNKVPIWSTSLDGVRRSDTEPRYFGVDVEIFQEWGRAITLEEALELSS